MSGQERVLDEKGWVGRFLLAIRSQTDKPVVAGINGVACTRATCERAPLPTVVWPAGRAAAAPRQLAAGTPEFRSRSCQFLPSCQSAVSGVRRRLGRVSGQRRRRSFGQSRSRRPHHVTCESSSHTTLASIFDWPRTRSVNVIGTSTAGSPRCTSRYLFWMANR